MKEPAPKGDGDELRIKYGAWLIGFALLFLGVVFVVALSRFKKADDVVAIVGAFTGVVGTVVGAFFGVQVGQAGKEDAEKGRKDAEEAARVYSSLLEPGKAEDARRMLAG